MQAQRNERRRWRVAGLALLLTLGGVLAAELVARRFLPDGPASFRFRSFVPGESRVDFLVEDRHTAYVLAAGYRESAEHAGAYATGAWPGRGGPPPAGSGHLAVFGDSCVYGVGVRTSETLPAQIEAALVRDGQSSARVVNYGVPGFSTAQVLPRLHSVLRQHRPRTAVFYLSSWNDQAPSIDAPDAVVLARRSGLRSWLGRTALAMLVRRTRDDDGLAPVAHDETPGAGEHESAPREARVPPAAFAENVRALLVLCRDAEVEPLVLLPSYPAQTLAGHPRLDQDRQVVRSIAEHLNVTVLDTRPLLDAAGLADGLAFVDFVHPSAAANAVLAAAAAVHVSQTARAPAPLSIRSVDPPRACSLGDVPVIVGVDGLAAREEPVILVGGAPLLDVRDLGDGRFEGLLMANGPGHHDLVVQGRAGVARRSQALELWEPYLELDAGGTLLFVARPADEAVVVAAGGLLAEPVVEPRGSAWLDPKTLLASFPALVMDADGRAVVPLATDEEGSAARWFQALVSPAGGGVNAKRYSTVFDRTAGRSR